MDLESAAQKAFTQYRIQCQQELSNQIINPKLQFKLIKPLDASNTKHCKVIIFGDAIHHEVQQLYQKLRDAEAQGPDYWKQFVAAGVGTAALMSGCVSGNAPVAVSGAATVLLAAHSSKTKMDKAAQYEKAAKAYVRVIDSEEQNQHISAYISAALMNRYYNVITQLQNNENGVLKFAKYFTELLFNFVLENTYHFQNRDHCVSVMLKESVGSKQRKKFFSNKDRVYLSQGGHYCMSDILFRAPATDELGSVYYKEGQKKKCFSFPFQRVRNFKEAIDLGYTPQLNMYKQLPDLFALFDGMSEGNVYVSEGFDDMCLLPKDVHQKMKTFNDETHSRLSKLKIGSSVDNSSNNQFKEAKKFVKKFTEYVSYLYDYFPASLEINRNGVQMCQLRRMFNNDLHNGTTNTIQLIGYSLQLYTLLETKWNVMYAIYEIQLRDNTEMRDLTGIVNGKRGYFRKQLKCFLNEHIMNNAQKDADERMKKAANQTYEESKEGISQINLSTNPAPISSVGAVQSKPTKCNLFQNTVNVFNLNKNANKILDSVFDKLNVPEKHRPVAKTSAKVIGSMILFCLTGGTVVLCNLCWRGAIVAGLVTLQVCTIAINLIPEYNEYLKKCKAINNILRNISNVRQRSNDLERKHHQRILLRIEGTQTNINAIEETDIENEVANEYYKCLENLRAMLVNCTNERKRGKMERAFNGFDNCVGDQDDSKIKWLIEDLKGFIIQFSATSDSL